MEHKIPQCCNCATATRSGGFTALHEAFYSHATKSRGAYWSTSPQDLSPQCYFQAKAAQTGHELGTTSSTWLSAGEGEAGSCAGSIRPEESLVGKAIARGCGEGCSHGKAPPTARRPPDVSPLPAMLPFKGFGDVTARSGLAVRRARARAPPPALRRGLAGAHVRRPLPGLWRGPRAAPIGRGAGGAGAMRRRSAGPGGRRRRQ